MNDKVRLWGVVGGVGLGAWFLACCGGLAVWTVVAPPPRHGTPPGGDQGAQKGSPKSAIQKRSKPGTPYLTTEFVGLYDGRMKGERAGVLGYVKHIDGDTLVLWGREQFDTLIECRILPGERWKLGHFKPGWMVWVHGEISSAEPQDGPRLAK